METPHNYKKYTLFFLLATVVLQVKALTAHPSPQGSDDIKFERISREHGLSQAAVHCIYQDRRGFLWFGTGDGVNRYDGYAFVVYKYDPEKPESLSHNYVRTVYEDRDGVLWLGTEGGGLNRFDREREVFIHYKHKPHIIDSLSSDKVYKIYEDRRGELWVGTYNGLNRFNRATEGFIHYKHDPDDPHSISHDFVLSIYEDRDGTLWIGTANGLNRFDRTEEKFFHYNHDPDNPETISDNRIYSICEDRLGFLWICTEDGLNKFDRQTERFIHYKHDLDNPSGISDSRTYCVYEDSLGVLWIGTIGGGLNRYEREKQEFLHYKMSSTDNTSISDNVIKSIYEDSCGNLWFGTSTGGVNKFDRTKHQFVRYVKSTNTAHSLSNDCILALCEDRSGEVWIGTNDGLNRLDVGSGRFTHYKHEPGDPGSLNHNRVYALFEDHTGKLWIGTFDGLSAFNKQTEEFTHFRHDPDDPHSFCQSNVYVIYEDHFGDLWMSTNNGISKFNPGTEEFKNYDTSDGLTCKEFNLGACHKNRQGEMFFGGVRGFVSFHPDNIQDNPHIPPVVITDFQIFNRSVKVSDHTFLEESIGETEGITLSYKESVFSFEFAALHFSAPEKNQYAYMMEGFDKDWIYSGTRRFSTYTNLNPGEYTFRVKASNKDGVWNEQGASLKIRITPPPWKTWWAYSLYILLMLGMIVGFIKYKMKRQAEAFEGKIREAEIRNLKELNQQKSNFFINLAHETKTPLTLIHNYLKSYIEKVGLTEDLRIIKQNIDKLNRDMVNFLDSEKLERGQIFYNHNHILDLSDAVEQKVILFEEITRKKKIRIRHTVEKNVSMKADPYAIDRVLNNLIDNAIRYTDEGGKVEVILKSNIEDIELVIRDTGIGISEKQKKNIFLPYYQISHEKRNIQGIGMGLSIVKKIVESMKGTITVESEPGKGSMFTVVFKKYSLKEGETAQRDIEYSKPIDNISSFTLKEDEIKRDSPTVLLIEDNLYLLRYLKTSMSAYYNVFFATDGEEALDKLKSIPKPDIIISDIMMDGMDGYQFCDEILKDRRLQDVPFLFLTAKTSLDEKMKGLSLGAIDYMYKPFLIDELIVKVDSIIKNREMQRESNREEIEEKIVKTIRAGTNEKESYMKFNALCNRYGITSREKQITQRLIQGLENKEIAFELHISINTVRNHIKSIYEKCGVKNRVEFTNLINRPNAGFHAQ